MQGRKQKMKPDWIKRLNLGERIAVKTPNRRFYIKIVEASLGMKFLSAFMWQDNDWIRIKHTNVPWGIGDKPSEIAFDWLSNLTEDYDL
jgi:hypothetical protein